MKKKEKETEVDRIKNQNTMVVYYYHTDAESAENILDSKLLKKADGRFGTGVYLTKMLYDVSGPGTLTTLPVNNYDDDVSKAQIKKLISRRGKDAEVCLSLDIPYDFAEEFAERCYNDGEDVYIFYKGDISFSDVYRVELIYTE